MDGHGLRAVLAQMQRPQPAVHSQRILRRTMAGGFEYDVPFVPFDHARQQTHRSLLRDERGNRHILHLVSGGGRVSSSANTKLQITPSVTVTPIARNTGTSASPSSANTISVDSEHTSTACS